MKNSPTIASRLGLDKIEFWNMNVQEIETLPKFDIVANLGGLYHVENPQDILLKSFNLARKFLIVQTVVSMEDESADYFESPAPGWTWSSRFSRNWLLKIMRENGFTVETLHFNELLGNDKRSDRGNLCILVSK